MMVLLLSVLVCFFANTAERSEMFEGYGNLFDAGVKNLELFVEMQRTRNLLQDAITEFQRIGRTTEDLSKNYEFLEARVKKNTYQQEYLKFLNEGVTILKESFKDFIGRHNGEIINFGNFREMKTFYNFSLRSVDKFCNAKFILFNDKFCDSLERELKNERKLMHSDPNLFPVIYLLLITQRNDLKEYYKKKDAGIKDNEFKELGKSLKAFCKYALLYNSCCVMSETKAN
jgi:hypothetical protein